MKTETVEDIPNWAASYIMYGDDSGIDENDRKVCDEFLAGLRDEGLVLACPVCGTQDDFCAHPAFGLACDTQDWTAFVI